MPERIAGFLPPRDLVIYRKVPQSQRNTYEAALSGIKRLGDPKYQDYLDRRGFSESDLDHVCTMLGEVNLIESKYPTISRTADLSKVRFLSILHDAGEICVGDVPIALQQTPQGRRKKEREPVHALTCVIGKIEDPQLKQDASDLYQRYIGQKDFNKNMLAGNMDAFLNPDIEVLLTKYIDMYAGTIIVNSNTVFSDWIDKGLKEPPQEMVDHVKERAHAMYNHMIGLRQSLGMRARYKT